MIYICSSENKMLFDEILNDNDQKVCFGNSKIDKMIFPELIDENVIIYCSNKNSLKNYYDQKYIDIGYYNGFPIVDNMESLKKVLLDYKKELKIGTLTREIIENDSSFKFLIEGESKKIYEHELYPGKVFIILKNTIYSHSKQTSDTIDGLSEIRATGSKFFLEMMRRNDLNHAYVCINNNGIILSKKVEVNNLEIVVKKYCEGTDKHSYYKYKENHTTPEGLYVNGPYVRFDWRNPNHVDKEGRDLKEDPNFYKKPLEERMNGIPLGDKNINENLVKDMVNVVKTREIALKTFYTIQYYFRKCSLIIKDVCFMISKDGIIYSEINQDCMRISQQENSSTSSSTSSTTTTYDKDIWRIGGSSAKNLILEKWTLFNNIFNDFFAKNSYDINKEYIRDYRTEMKLDVKENFVHYDIFKRIINENNKRFVLLCDKSENQEQLTVPDLMFTSFDEQISKKYYPHTFVSSKDEAILALSNSTRRVITEVFYEDIPINRQILYIKNFFNSNEEIPNEEIPIMIPYKEGMYRYIKNIKNKIFVVFSNEKTENEKTENESFNEFLNDVYSMKLIPVISSKNFSFKLFEDCLVSNETTIIVQDISGKIKETFKTRSLTNEIKSRKPFKIIINHITNDSVIFIVNKSEIKQFSNQTIIKTSLLNIKKNTESSEEALLKLFQNIWKIEENPSKFLHYFLSYINAKNISLENIQNELNSERWNPYPIKTVKNSKKIIAVSLTKYMDRTHNYMLKNIGVKILENKNKRSLIINYEIIDSSLFHNYFSSEEIIFMNCKPKDMPWLMAFDRIDGAITYNSIMDNYPKTYSKSFVEVADGLSMCLISKDNFEEKEKYNIVCEHYNFIKKYFNNFEGDIVMGSSESYLINSDYDLCDSIVESGETIRANNLKIFKKLDIPIVIGLYIK